MGKPPAHPSGQSPYISYQGSPMMIMDSGTAPPDGNATRMGAGFLTAGDGARSRRSLRPDLFSPIRFTTRSCTHLLAPHRGRSSGGVLGAWSPSGCMPQYWKAGGVMVRRQVVHSHEVRRPRFSRPAATGMPRSCDIRSSTHVAIHDQHLVSKWKQLLVTQAQ